MGRSFEDWMKGVEPEEAPKAPEPEKFYDYDEELPPGVDFGDAPGTYQYLCRGCDKWHPMDWELNEDHYDSHYCGGSPYCCPCKPTDVWLKHKKVVTPEPKKKAQPTTARSQKEKEDEYRKLYGGIPPAAPNMAPTHFQCPGCGRWERVSRAHMTRDGQMVCGAYGCVPPERMAQAKHEYEARVRAGMPKIGAAREAYNQLQQTFVCPGCNLRIPRDCAHGHPDTRQPYCGDAYCQERMRNEQIRYKVPPPPPRAG